MTNYLQQEYGTVGKAEEHEGGRQAEYRAAQDEYAPRVECEAFREVAQAMLRNDYPSKSCKKDNGSKCDCHRELKEGKRPMMETKAVTHRK